MEASKASTMRMVMFTELGIECSYTVEASLAGAQGRHFSIEDLVCMGADLGRWCVMRHCGACGEAMKALL
jgi:hypothetical protein